MVTNRLWRESGLLLQTDLYVSTSRIIWQSRAPSLANKGEGKLQNTNHKLQTNIGPLENGENRLWIE